MEANQPLVANDDMSKVLRCRWLPVPAFAGRTYLECYIQLILMDYSEESDGLPSCTIWQFLFNIVSFYTQLVCNCVVYRYWKSGFSVESTCLMCLISVSVKQVIALSISLPHWLYCSFSPYILCFFFSPCTF